MLPRITLLLLAPLALLFAPALPAGTAQGPVIDQSQGRAHFDFRVGTRSVRVYTYHPPGVTPDTRIVFAHHGAGRNGRTFLNPWVELADRYRCIVLSPQFSSEEWPGSGSYNLGFLRSGGQPVPEEHWAYSAPDQIFEHYKRATGNRTERYFIFGHSAGGQFVHRLLLLKPDAKWEVAAPANAGWYTLADLDEAWPYGLRGSVRPDPENLKQALERRVAILLGDRDTNPNHSQLRRTAGANRQGPHRFARGQTFFERARASAQRVGANFNWSVVVAEGVAHSGGRMAPYAARAFFESEAPAPAD